MMRVRKGIGAAALLLSAVLLFGGCQRKTEGSLDPAVSGIPGLSAAREELVIIMAAEPETLDPHSDTGADTARISRQIFEPLVTVNGAGEIEPCLAERWEYEAEDTVLFHLRRDVRFHNGEDLRSSDVLYSLRRGLEIAPQVASILDAMDLERSEIVDDHTLRIRLFYPFAPLLRHLAHPSAAIVSEKELKETGDEAFARSPGGGTGAFRFGARTDGGVTLERFDEYWGEEPAARTVTFQFADKEVERVAALAAGTADIALDIGGEGAGEIGGNPELALLRAPGLGNTFLRFNPGREPLGDVHLRLAMAKALDAGALIREVFSGVGVLSRGVISSAVWGYNDAYPHYGYDPEEAKRLLSAAGYPAGFSVSLMVTDDGERVQLAKAVQKQWKEIGIDCVLSVCGIGEFYDRFAAGDFDICVFGVTSAVCDADYSLGLVWTSDASGQPPLFADAELDRLFEEARRTTEEEIRKQLYFDMQSIIMDFVPAVPLIESEILAGTRKDVRGVLPDAADYFLCKDVYFE